MVEGIIPAYAGLTRRDELPMTAARDHPRLRGVNCVSLSVVVSDGGSSPLTRG